MFISSWLPMVYLTFWASILKSLIYWSMFLKEEGKVVKACLCDLLLGGVHKLLFEVREEVKVGVLDIVVYGELFKSFEDSFYPSVYLWSFDKGEGYCDSSYWGFKAWYPLVHHHIDLEFLYKGICASSVTIKDKGGNPCRFKISCGENRDEMGRGYFSGSL